jgi:hypothetical protein
LEKLERALINWKNCATDYDTATADDDRTVLQVRFPTRYGALRTSIVRDKENQHPETVSLQFLLLQQYAVTL